MKLSFVHVVDQIQYEPMTAQLAAIARGLGWSVASSPTDYGTGKEAFTESLFAKDPDAVAFRVTGETREVIAYICRVIRESRPGLPLLFFGPLANTHPESVIGIVDPAIILVGEPQAALAELLRGAASGSWPSAPPAGVWFASGSTCAKGPEAPLFDPARAPMPDLEVMGGEALLRRGIGCSFFGEVGIAPIESGFGTPSGPAAVAGLQALSTFTRFPPRLRRIEDIVGWMADWAPRVRHFEFHDREFAWDTAFAGALLAALHDRLPAVTYSLRFLAGTAPLDWIEGLDPRRCPRLVFEYDAGSVDAARRLPGTTDPARLEAVIRKAQARGHAIGLLASVGLPFESAAGIDDKLAFIRRAGIERVRFIPFEPRYGSDLFTICSDNDMLPKGPEVWNREVYSPLVQDGLEPEAWYLAWQRCLDLQAELQHRFPLQRAFAPGAGR